MGVFITLVSIFCISLMSALLTDIQCQQQVSNDDAMQPYSPKGVYSDQLVLASPTQLGSIILTPTHTSTYEKEVKSKHHQTSNKKIYYKKLHKLVDELMREEQAERKLEKELSQLEQEKLVLMMKKKLPTTFTASDGSNQVLTPSMSQPFGEQQQKTLDLSLGSQNAVDGNSGQAEQQVLNRNLNSAEHARRILDDRFGIMKEAKFSSNNHLGIKGVPKFGSEEEY